MSKLLIFTVGVVSFLYSHMYKEEGWIGLIALTVVFGIIFIFAFVIDWSFNVIRNNNQSNHAPMEDKNGTN